ncbi:Translation initiation factor SUI1 family protein [Leishmania donovani]|uniref:Translation initiation factor SUI1 family protein n=1 Tax=Leishmania donovani TaxID=5661 RepID=A0A504WVJ9_LEIDO|nr:Translation initiation factor SUI1 family protein [Leishmania donovani]
MGRSKRSKATAHAQPCSDGEREEEHDSAPATVLPEQAEGCGDENGASAAADGAQATPDQHSGRCSERGRDSDDDAPKTKKKEYRGNRLKKLERAVEVLYCPICTFPAEMCEFSGIVEKCRPWLLEYAADLADAEERGRKRRILTEKDRLEAMLEGRGVKKALERIVVLEVEKRTGRRMITSVFGMDLFGFNLKDVSRDWRKRFSCGAGVRAAEEGKHQDCIDIQGNVVDQLADMLITKYRIPKESVYLMEGKKKVPYPY